MNTFKAQNKSIFKAKRQTFLAKPEQPDRDSGEPPETAPEVEQVNPKERAEEMHSQYHGSHTEVRASIHAFSRSDQEYEREVADRYTEHFDKLHTPRALLERCKSHADPKKIEAYQKALAQLEAVLAGLKSEIELGGTETHEIDEDQPERDQTRSIDHTQRTFDTINKDTFQKIIEGEELDDEGRKIDISTLSTQYIDELFKFCEKYPENFDDLFDVINDSISNEKGKINVNQLSQSAITILINHFSIS